MKKTKHLSIIMTLLALPFLVSAQAFGQNFWKYFPSKTVPTKGQRLLIPKKYKIVQINKTDARDFLNGLSSLPQQAQTIVLPTPDGGKQAFKIWQTSMMAPSLQKRYPLIRTYTAYAVNDPYVTAKIDYTVLGFHAMVFQPGKVWLIDPYSNKDDGYYMVFYQAEAPMPAADRMVCHFDNSTQNNLDISGTPTRIRPSEGVYGRHLAHRTSDNVKRTYRLALSCTGEYAEAVAGNNPTRAAVFSAMTTSMNRVNGIYEREVDVTMQFIAQEDSLIYLNPNTDPFDANNNGGALLDENQDNTDNVVGNNAYDIGHIFSTGGGGIAQLGCVCSSNQKAMGVTGSPNPVGDAYDVDYVAHEMGHQFGANHAFNDCSGNENMSTAYEPGSGSTIMCYAGICGVNNLQMHSNDYFHAVSLNEISSFLNTSGHYFGHSYGGATCGTTDNLNVPMPNFSSINQTYVIPAATPFELIAPEATVTGGTPDSLSYCWEQWDLGNLQQPEADGATFVTGPTMRSYYPKINNRIRMFPNVHAVVANKTEVLGERISTVSRYMHFKLTVRTNKNGWGAFMVSPDSLTVRVVNTDSPFSVTYPDAAGLSFTANSDINVKWHTAGTQVAPIQCSTVDIFLSTDSGYTYQALAMNVPNNGEATVTLPNLNTTVGRIMVKGHNNIFFDISNHIFTMTGATSGISSSALNKAVRVFPNPATSVLHLQSNLSQTLNVRLVNALGQTVWTGHFQNRLDVPTNHFAKGFYFVQFSDTVSGWQATKKVILK